MTKSSKTVLQELSLKGFRQTETRKLILELFNSASKPLSVPEIIKKLDHSGFSKNKTTVYREIDFLTSQEILKEVHLKPRVVHYELTSLPHHHHVTCNECGKIEKVMSEELENAIEKIIKRLGKKGYSECSHKLEFTAKCISCKT